MAYADLLKDPRWQKKRLEIMKRDYFTCQSCGDDKSTLNVHHAYYENGKKPWEYPDDSLITWCEDCHVERKEMSKQLSMLTLEYTIEDMTALLGFLSNPEGHQETICANIHNLQEWYSDLTGGWFNTEHISKMIASMVASIYETGQSLKPEA